MVVEVTGHAGAPWGRYISPVIIVVGALEPQKQVRRGERPNASASDKRPSLCQRIVEELLALVGREMTGPDHDCRSPSLVRLKLGVGKTRAIRIIRFVGVHGCAVHRQRDVGGLGVVRKRRLRGH